MTYITSLLDAEHLHEIKSWQKFQHIACPAALIFAPSQANCPGF